MCCISFRVNRQSSADSVSVVISHHSGEAACVADNMPIKQAISWVTAKQLQISLQDLDISMFPSFHLSAVFNLIFRTVFEIFSLFQLCIPTCC